MLTPSGFDAMLCVCQLFVCLDWDVLLYHWILFSTLSLALITWLGSQFSQWLVLPAALSCQSLSCVLLECAHTCTDK